MGLSSDFAGDPPPAGQRHGRDRFPAPYTEDCPLSVASRSPASKCCSRIRGVRDPHYPSAHVRAVGPSVAFTRHQLSTDYTISMFEFDFRQRQHPLEVLRRSLDTERIQSGFAFSKPSPFRHLGNRSRPGKRMAICCTRSNCYDP
jgi:hypothetical protein